MENFSEKITWFMPLPKNEIFSDSENISPFSDCELFSSGRDALFRILKIENFSSTKTLWLPEYFCPSLLRSLKKLVDIKTYIDIPSEENARFESLKPNVGDAVLVVNFFGTRSVESWNKWFADKTDIIRIDDISHTPLCDWKNKTDANYIFASLRKSLPLPDGGYLWKKNAKASKIFSVGGESADFAVDMLSAASIQNIFGYDKRANSLYYAGENKLDSKILPSRISKYSYEILQKLDCEKIAKKTSENLLTFLSNFSDSKNCIELNRHLKNTSTQKNIFCPILKFATPQLRDKCHNALFEIGVMPSIYWGGFGCEISESAKNERDTSLAIPLDFRHSTLDAEKLGKFISKVCSNS